MTRRANGEGSVYQRKDGRWVGSVMVFTEAGTRARRAVYGRTRAEAHDKLVTLLRATQQGLPVASESLRVGAYLEGWLRDVAAVRVRPTTLRSYGIFVRCHLVPGLGDRRLARLSPADIRTFLKAKQGSGLSARSVQYMHAVLRVALEDATRDGLVGRNVAKLVATPTVRREEVRPLDPTQARRFLDVARQDRDYALWVVALAVGLRRGEVLGLAWDDVDLDAGTLRVRQAVQRVNGHLELVEPKTQRSRRTVPLPEIARDALRAHRVRQASERLVAGSTWRDSGLVFTSVVGGPLEPRNVSRRFKALAETAGLADTVRLHDLRHTCASFLLAQGVQPRVVMETLGHSGIALTMNTYAHVMPSAQREAAEQMDRALRG